MRCDDTLLQLYVDGALQAAEGLIVAEHLRSCRRCQSHLLQYKALLWDLEHAPPAPAPAELAELSDTLMEAWNRAPVGSRSDPGSVWVRTPVVASALSAVGQGGAHVGQSVLRQLWRLVLGGGGRR